MNNVFPQYEKMTLSYFEVTTPVLKEAAATVEDYLSDIATARLRGLGISFLGQNGIGKTMLASIVMGAAKDAGFKIECIELATYIDLWQEMFRISDEDRIEYVNDQLRYIKRCHFLLLDDLGREHESVSGWSNERVFDLMRYRHNRCLPTLITSNLPLPELDTRYSEGMSSHLHGSSLFVVMDGEDYRVGKGLADAEWSARH